MSIGQIALAVVVIVIALAFLSCIVAGVAYSVRDWWKSRRPQPRRQDPPSFEVTPQTVSRLVDEIYTHLGPGSNR